MDKFMNETDRTALLRDIYGHLQDDESRRIYAARSLYSLSDDKSFMDGMVADMAISKELRRWVHGKNNLVLFGAGTWGKAITYYFRDIRWDYVADNNRAGQELNGYRVSNVSDISDIRKCHIVLAVLFKYKEIEAQLIGLGIPREKILVLGRMVEERQYFDLPELTLADDEVFVDCGGFNGDTSLQFYKLAKGNGGATFSLCVRAECSACRGMPANALRHTKLHRNSERNMGLQHYAEVCGGW